MKRLLNIWKRLTTQPYRARYLRLAVLCLLTFLPLWTMPTESSAKVMQSGIDTVTMNGSDLYKLVDGYTRYKTEAEATREALVSERKAHMDYSNDVGILMERQAQERVEFQNVIKTLERRLSAPSLEFYGGYNMKDQWEGGIRVVWSLR